MMIRKPARWTVSLSICFALMFFLVACSKTEPKTETAKPAPVVESQAVALSKTQTAKPVTLAPQTTCPVMGGRINKNLFVDIQDKRIYVCCDMCTPEVKKDPDKYIKKLEAMGQGVETIEKK